MVCIEQVSHRENNYFVSNRRNFSLKMKINKDHARPSTDNKAKEKHKLT